MANAKRNCSSIFMVFMASFVPYLSNASQFNVGGSAGWVVNPPEDYNHWAGRMRFQVNDTLFFKYNKGSNSVLEVNKDDYFNCNVNNPILRMDDGNSIFKLNHSGPFFFISGNKTFCDQGQKIIIVVLAIRHRLPPQTPPPAGQPPASTPAPSPASVPVPAPSPPSVPVPAPSPPSVPEPAPVPASVPVSGPGPVPAPGPASVPVSGPVPAPAPSISPISPSPIATPPSNAPTPGNSPVSPPPSSGEAPPPPSTGSPPLTPPGSVSPPPPSSTNPANSNSSSNAAARPAFTPSIFFISAVSIVLI